MIASSSSRVDVEDLVDDFVTFFIAGKCIIISGGLGGGGGVGGAERELARPVIVIY